MLQKNKRIRAKVPAVLEPLMIIHVDRLDRAIEPGLNAINWTSINAEAYLIDVHAAFQDFELLVDRVSDIITYRIDAVLSEMSATTLVDLPADEPWTVDHFIERTQVLSARLQFRPTLPFFAFTSVHQLLRYHSHHPSLSRSFISLGLMSPGAATDGCRPIFLCSVIASESDDLFELSSAHHSHLPTSFIECSF